MLAGKRHSMTVKVRTVFGVLLALVVGVIALPFVFSDLGPEETVARRVALAGGVFFVGGVLSGALASRRWPVSGLCAWTPFGMGLFMLVSKLTVRGEMPYWSAIGTFLLAPLIVAVIGGFVGSRLASRIAKR